MFKHLFASMNEMLDEVMSQYSSAKGSTKRELHEKLRAIKTMSDECIEEWLLLEEKLGQFMNANNITLGGPGAYAFDPLDPEVAGKRSDLFVRGQGYYKLHMFEEAIEQFETLIQREPHFTLGRIYLAMAYLKKGDAEESYSQFQFLSQLTENLQMKAISYNAMGCIQAQNQNMDKACEYFNLAYRTDPSSVEPLIELGMCREKKGGLQFTFQSSR
jgi:tetratricopeptide (TPR) repeat protein